MIWQPFLHFKILSRYLFLLLALLHYVLQYWHNYQHYYLVCFRYSYLPFLTQFDLSVPVRFPVSVEPIPTESCGQGRQVPTSTLSVRPPCTMSFQ